MDISVLTFSGVNLFLSVAGVILLVGVAVVVGLATAVDGRSRARAWRAIADERRLLHEERLRNHEVLYGDRCPECPHEELAGS